MLYVHSLQKVTHDANKYTFINMFKNIPLFFINILRPFLRPSLAFLIIRIQSVYTNSTQLYDKTTWFYT